MIGFSKYFQFRFFITCAGRQSAAQSMLLFLLLLFTASCKKYLDAKPDKKLVVPTSVNDLQGILDYYNYMNINCSQADEIAADNYYLKDNDYLALTDDRMRDAYLWKENIFARMNPTDWQNLYTVIYNANIVLENLPKIERNSQNASVWDNCQGSALVFRGKSFYEIAQIWALAYDNTTSSSDLGIPLRLSSDFNIPTRRSSVEATYAQIISDLKSAIPLLPNSPTFVYRPSKPVAYALLARTYLAMRDYNNARLYADSCLQIKNTLLDFNTLNTGVEYPFSSIQFSNPEDIMHTVCFSTNYNIKKAYGKIDSNLYQSYDVNDLRKTVFFKSNGDGTYYFTGNYDGASSSATYNGIAIDEVYLIRAECAARQGDINSAMNDLNTLMKKRWKNTVSYVAFTAVSSADALSKILIERRKELVYRHLRFMDIKRLNKEGANITLKRIIQNQTYILPPNDPRYALPIPENVIQITGIQQN